MYACFCSICTWCRHIYAIGSDANSDTTRSGNCPGVVLTAHISQDLMHTQSHPAHTSKHQAPSNFDCRVSEELMVDSECNQWAAQMTWQVGTKHLIKYLKLQCIGRSQLPPHLHLGNTWAMEVPLREERHLLPPRVYQSHPFPRPVPPSHIY